MILLLDRSIALEKIHDGLLKSKSEILSANKIDLDSATKNNLSSSLINRLDLSKNGKFDSMLSGILDVSKLDDPLNKITLATQLDDNLNLYRLTCPVGVLLIIFESRPEVIANITSLAIKSGNAAILKGGKESLNTFQEMSKIINSILVNETDIPDNSIQLISSRSEVSDLLVQDKYIDLVIPRGSNELVKNIKENTKIPVLGHADGICSIYLDKDMELEKAKKIIIDSKTNYSAGCNSVETLLVNESLIGSSDLNKILQSLFDAKVTCHIENDLLEKLDSKFIESNKDRSNSLFNSTLNECGRVLVTPLSHKGRIEYEKVGIKNLNDLGEGLKYEYYKGGESIKKKFKQFKNNSVPLNQEVKFNPESGLGHSADSLVNVFNHLKKLGVKFIFGSDGEVTSVKHLDNNRSICSYC